MKKKPKAIKIIEQTQTAEHSEVKPNKKQEHANEWRKDFTAVNVWLESGSTKKSQMFPHKVSRENRPSELVRRT